MQMAPQMAQFESKYQDKVNIIDIDLDKKDSPDYKKYEDVLKRSNSIPFTVWMDKSGKILGEEAGGMSAEQLESKTQSFLH